MPAPRHPHRRVAARGAALLAVPLSLACVSGCVSGGPNAAASPTAPSSTASTASTGSSAASSAPARVVVPDLGGVNAAMARDQLSRRGLKKITFASAEPGVRFVVQSADWHVTKQSAAPGRTAPADGRITLDVRKGVGAGGSPPSGSATMPDVLGKDGSAALAVLKKAGCWKAVLGSVDPAHQMVINPSDWRVTKQLVPPGRRFDPNSVVVLAVRKPG